MATARLRDLVRAAVNAARLMESKRVALRVSSAATSAAASDLEAAKTAFADASYRASRHLQRGVYEFDDVVVVVDASGISVEGLQQVEDKVVTDV